MYCPKCATENGDGAKFCRQCGANISLVPQALSGSVAEARQPDAAAVDQYRRTIESGLKKSLIGVGFVLVAIAMLAGRNHDGWIMLIPAAIFLGTGVSQILAFKYTEHLMLRTVAQPNPVEASHQSGRQLLDSAIPSITEQTTRNMKDPENGRRIQ
jgi:hypothetical protein